MHDDYRFHGILGYYGRWCEEVVLLTGALSGERVSKVSVHASVTLPSSCVAQAFETFSRSVIAPVGRI